MDYGTKKIIGLSIILLLAAGCQQNKITNDYTTALAVGKQKLFVAIAGAPLAQALGLSGRARMDKNQGMLFMFAKPGIYTFWMKDMKFNLDFIWIANGKIVGIAKNAPAPSAETKIEELPRYNPPLPVDEVLEVNAGWIEKNQIKIGAEVRF